MGVFPANILLQQGRIDYYLVETVIRHFHYPVADRIIEVFFFQYGIGECKAQRDAVFVEEMHDLLSLLIVIYTAEVSSSVPDSLGERTVYRGYLYAFAEVFGTVFKH